MRLIVGLGNPGREYDNTRHNMGFMVVDELSKKWGFDFNKKKFDGVYGEKIINGEKIIILKPQKFINLSGEVIRKFVDYFKIDIDDILVIHDDLDTPIGKYKLRYQGSSGGHNGLKNIEFNLATRNYKRIKIGISNNKKMDTKDYVLGKFNKEDQTLVNRVIDDMIMILNDYLVLSFDNVMNKYNKK